MSQIFSKSHTLKSSVQKYAYHLRLDFAGNTSDKNTIWVHPGEPLRYGTIQRSRVTPGFYQLARFWDLVGASHDN